MALGSDDDRGNVAVGVPRWRAARVLNGGTLGSFRRPRRDHTRTLERTRSPRFLDPTKKKGRHNQTKPSYSTHKRNRGSGFVVSGSGTAPSEWLERTKRVALLLDTPRNNCSRRDTRWHSLTASSFVTDRDDTVGVVVAKRQNIFRMFALVRLVFDRGTFMALQISTRLLHNCHVLPPTATACLYCCMQFPSAQLRIQMLVQRTTGTTRLVQAYTYLSHAHRSIAAAVT